MADNFDESVSNHVPAAAEEADEQAVGVDQPEDLAGGAEIEAVDGYALPQPLLAPEVAAAAPDLTGLVDAVEASFPRPLVPESVIANDDRVQISPASDFPWRVHCSLRITANDGSQWIGTAFFIGRRILATAGHNLFINGGNPARNGWVRRVEVIPGRDGASMPFGSTTSTRFYSVRGWTNNADPDYDYGAIIIDENDEGIALGDRTGWLGYGAYSDSTLNSVVGNLAGYPGDKPQGTQWYMARRVSSVSARKVFYEIDTAGGQSGSAVYRIRDGKRYAFGIHAYGVGTNPLNSATRITRPAFDNLRSWKADNS